MAGLNRRRLLRGGAAAGLVAASARTVRAQSKPEKLVYIGENQGGWKKTLTEEVGPRSAAARRGRCGFGGGFGAHRARPEQTRKTGLYRREPGWLEEDPDRGGRAEIGCCAAGPLRVWWRLRRAPCAPRANPKNWSISARTRVAGRRP